MKRPIALIVMDGLGLADSGKGNAVTLANTPNLDRLFKEYPHQTLEASGRAVGLPEGQMGNSEVGHLNIGAGRIVYQSLTRIHQAIEDGSFYENQAYLETIDHVVKQDSHLHVIGLLSDGGVHSHIEHFKALTAMAKKAGVAHLYVHCFLDGRDVPPQSALDYMNDLETYLTLHNYGKVSSVHGRYYAMDRDKNWDRTQRTYDLLVYGKGKKAPSAKEGIAASYQEGVGDEFMIPFATDHHQTIQNGDGVIFMNFRPDRAIQLSTALTNPPRSGLVGALKFTDFSFVSTMHYSEHVKGKIAFDLQKLSDMYGEVISKAGLKQLRIAETEKYAHVTFFFDGGEDKEIDGSTRVLVASPKVATYDLQPEMSAYLVTDKVLEEIDKNSHDTIILNYANCDMVGHTGVIGAAVKAVETVDQCVGKVVEKILEKNGIAIITADHGNAEKMLDSNGGIHTAHTNSRVPIIITDPTIAIREGGILADIAPTMLEYLNLEKPQAMTGNSLIMKTIK